MSYFRCHTDQHSVKLELGTKHVTAYKNFLCHTMLATQNETNSCHQFRRHMERISPGSTDSCRVAEQLMCRADVPNSTLALTWREDRCCKTSSAAVLILLASTSLDDPARIVECASAKRRNKSVHIRFTFCNNVSLGLYTVLRFIIIHLYSPVRMLFKQTNVLYCK